MVSGAFDKGELVKRTEKYDRDLKGWVQEFKKGDSKSYRVVTPKRWSKMEKDTRDFYSEDARRHFDYMEFK